MQEKDRQHGTKFLSCDVTRIRITIQKFFQRGTFRRQGRLIHGKHRVVEVIVIVATPPPRRNPGLINIVLGRIVRDRTDMGRPQGRIGAQLVF